MSTLAHQQVARAVTGDDSALTELLRRHGPEVRASIAPRIGAHWRSVIDADDVMQVTYLEAFLRIESFNAGENPDAAFLAWLHRIADNNLKDAIRSLERAKRPDPRRRVQSAPNEQSYVDLVEVLGVVSATPSRAAAATEAQNAIERTLAKLPPDYAEVIRQYDLRGQEAEDVAAHMRRSTGAVFMLRARAHDRLRELIGAESQFFTNTA